MIITQLMRAFPGKGLIYLPSSFDDWYVCTLQGALPYGMSEWLAQHNLKAVPTGAFYNIFWLSHPDSEKKMFEVVYGQALAHVSADYEGISKYPGREPLLIGYSKKLEAFEKACREAGLL